MRRGRFTGIVSRFVVVGYWVFRGVGGLLLDVALFFGDRCFEVGLR